MTGTAALPHQSLINANATVPEKYQVALGADGIPILDEVVEDAIFDDLASDIKAHLLLDLEPHLQELIRRAFTDSVRMIALDLKHAFERELNKQLDTRLRGLVDECVQKACQKVRVR